MANANSMQTSVYNQPSQTVNSTTETALTSVVTGVAGPLVFTVPPGIDVDGGKSFALHLRGFITGGTSATALFKLYLGTSATLTNNTLLASFTVSGAAVPSTGSQFDLNAILSWDSVSGSLHGYIVGVTAGTLTAPVAITPVASGVTLAGLSFVPSVTFGAALATNTVKVREFVGEQL
jgi:hypothetical protein